MLSIVEKGHPGAAIRVSLEAISGRKIQNELNVGGRSLFDAITTQHERKDFRLDQALTSLRERYEVDDISVLRWIAGKKIPADALTKRGVSTGPLLSTICTTNRLSVDLASGMISDNATKPRTRALCQAELQSLTGL